MPIDWAAVNWINVGLLSSFAFLATVPSFPFGRTGSHYAIGGRNSQGPASFFGLASPAFASRRIARASASGLTVCFNPHRGNLS
jgi:hypothetical protein